MYYILYRLIGESNNSIYASVSSALILNFGQNILIYRQQKIFNRTACQFNWLDLYVGVIWYCTINHSSSIC